MERLVFIDKLPKINDPVYDVMSIEIKSFLNNLGSRYEVAKTKNYNDKSADFEVAAGIAISKDGPPKKLPELIVNLPPINWVDTRDRSGFFRPVSAWTYISKARKNVESFIALLEQPDFGLKINRETGRLDNKFSLTDAYFNPEIYGYFRYKSTILSMSRFAVVYKDGTLKPLPDEIVCLPTPDWIVSNSNYPDSYLEPSWRTKSVAQQESRQFIKKLQRFLAFQPRDL